jgi:hypothetical protein
MGLMEHVLERVFGKVHIYVTVGNRPAIEIIFEDPDIIVDIKNPILAIEAGLDQMLARRGKKDGKMEFSSDRLKRLKKMGYRIIIRYKMLEFEL